MRGNLLIILCGAVALLPRLQIAETARIEFRGRYLGQEPPGRKPQAFAPDLFSIWGDYGFHLQTSVVFSSTGRELFFTNQVLPSVKGRSCSVLFMESVDDRWTDPSPVSFSSEYSDSGIFLSPDGRLVYFNSTRPVKGGGRSKDADIWFVEKRGRGWSAPKRLSPPVNGPFNDVGGAVTVSGSLFFSSDRQDGAGSYDVYSAKFAGGSFADVQNLGGAVNTAAAEYVVCVAPDSSFLIFYRMGSPETEDSRLYVTFRTASGAWTAAKSMGDHIAGLNASGASISQDGRILFLLCQGQGMYWLRTDIINYLRMNDLDISAALLNSFNESGVDAAVLTYNELKQKHAGYVDIDESLLNEMGYRLMDADRIMVAIDFFSIVIAIFPNSWNAYDSLGEAYVAAGDIDAARMSYQRSLELNPDNQNAIDALRMLGKR
jgi:hypothetical protein